MNTTPATTPEAAEAAEAAEAQYVDRLGRAWLLVFDYSTARRIKLATGLDFVNAHDGKALGAVAADDHQLVAVLQSLTEAQREELGVSVDDWAAGLDGPTLGRAIDALGDAVVFFSPPQRRPALRALLERVAEITTLGVTTAAAKLRGAKLDRLLAKAAAKADANLDRALAQLETSGSWPTN